MRSITMVQIPENISTLYNVDKRIVQLQSERHRLLEERKKPRQNLAELDIRLNMVRAELQTLYASKRSKRKAEELILS